MSPESEAGVSTGRVRRDKPVPCQWCGSPVAQVGRGRRRKYCSQSCRQRAYEQRAHVRGTGIPADALILRPELVEQLQDELFELRCAAEDVRTAAQEGEEAAEIADLAEELVAIAQRIEHIRGQR